jgi:dynein heavy chain
VTADRKVANEQSAIVAVDAAECNRQKEEAETISAACSKELEAALPALKKAEDALKNLSGKDINEMKQGNNPPYGVKLTMAAVAVMFGIKPKGKSDNLYDAFWDNAKKQLLGNANFLKNLTNYDKDAIDDPLIAKITPYIQFEDFTAETVQKRGSAAAAGLCTWVHAMYTYYNIAKNVKPLKEALKAAQASLAAAQEMYAQKAVALKEVTDKVAALEDALNKAMAEKEALKQKVVDCEAKLKRADALIKGLGGEKTRWTEMSKQLGQTYDNITGDILLSSGVIAYLGAFLASYREKAITQWSALLKVKNITCSDTFSLQTTLGSPVVIRSWTIARLPNDSFSIENAIMLFKSNRWPLMIDPQGQANKWVKKLEEPNSLKVVKQNQSNFVRVLEHAIQFGFPVLLENVPESLDPILESILLKAWTIQGGVPTLRLGDATVEYSLNFKFYITTKLRNPHYPPELCVKVNLLNFMATADGLQDQMLGRVVALEQKELEAQRQALVIEDADNQRQLKEIEDKILFMLKNAKGDILDDEVLIETLGDSKKTSNIIQEKVKIGEQTQVRIAKVRTGYIPVAFQASQLFFCIADLAAVDPMYQYSLDWYMALYESSVEGSEKSKILEERLRNLKSFFSFLLYKNVCRSLFEKDKLLFSFLLTTKIMLGDGNLSPVNLRFFLQGSTSMELSEPNPYSWMSDKSWGDIIEMRELKGFESFPEILATNAAAWSAIVDSNNPADLVSELCGDTFDPFQKLCILRCLRKDVIVPAVMQFIANAPEMGTKFIEPPPFNLRECYSDSKASTPLIFVLTPGAAPMVELQKLAEEEGMGGNKLRAISLGQGQEPIAERAIQDGQDKGTWVCLQNCHLCISWMPALEKICEEFSDELHPNFRLWLTSEPTPSFPPYVLQNGIKMTNEPPKGMRANLLGSFYTIESSWFESCLRKDEFKKMLFGLCFFHAGVRERRKFGPLGWNVQYVFSPPDLQISMDQLRIFLDDLRPEDPVPYAALAYLVGECNYGGRVTDDKDRRCILNILDDFYTDSILDDAYKFSPSGTYYAPPIGDLESFREYIRGLPYSEGPEMFGLHDNANITCAINETNSLLDTALSLQPRAAGGAGKSWGETLSELARDISAKQPKVFDIEKAVIIFPVRYEESMNTVLTQELIRFNRLIVEIATTLREVQKALKGLVVMSGELEDLGNSMVNGKVPKIWTKVSYPSLKGLGPWVSDFLDRITFLSDWMEKGSSPTVFWVSGFFFTQAFITGSLQNFARKMRIPIDKAEFDFRVLTTAEQESAKTRGPEDGSYIRGLFMEGARWDPENHEVSESLPRELFIQMPLIHLDPKPKAEVPIVEGVPEQYTGSRNGTAHVYMCPVYKTSLRQGVLMTTGHSTNFVMFIRLPMNAAQKQKHWIKRGVAMLTQLDF